jgi:hypothetical protein
MFGSAGGSSGTPNSPGSECSLDSFCRLGEEERAHIVKLAATLTPVHDRDPASSVPVTPVPYCDDASFVQALGSVQEPDAGMILGAVTGAQNFLAVVVCRGMSEILALMVNTSPPVGGLVLVLHVETVAKYADALVHQCMYDRMGAVSGMLVFMGSVALATYKVVSAVLRR